MIVHMHKVYMNEVNMHVINGFFYIVFFCTGSYVLA